MRLNKEEILHKDRHYRTALINTLAGYKTPVLIGTCNPQGIPNLALFNSLLHVGANPPLLGILSRPASVPRHTLTNILNTGFFTINFFSSDKIENAHQTAAKYPIDQSEFETCGWTPEYLSDCKAPFVQEAVIKIGLTLEEHVTLRSNQTVLIVGAVQTILLPDDALTEQGSVRLDHLDIPVVKGLDTYLQAQEIYSLSHPSLNAWPSRK